MVDVVSGRRSRGGRARRWGAVLGALVGTLALATLPSSAAGGGEPVVEPLTEGLAPDGLRIEAEGPTDVVQRIITIPPGGETGWHYHHGPLLGVIESGTLTRTLDGCAVEVSGPGDALVEPHGADHVHNGRNLGSEPVVLYATYVVPQGAPLSVPAENPGCPE
ncbi:cupin domain-containing protein [Streptomyces sp. 3MP-14]|uniref:Cupin domain-containing protein n=1 Tax=Streptomyces mimosae TaxID=2586635 RepID=A0A5N6A2M4_9ACTN|nr:MULTISPECIES: cupin domain-containing protein [Streptomyces]KAB8161930.1 cupin domain-containing protein [Streptomyces mimosae]KAB8173628.1 cupin domain-containing protein [Streptomyces sp. 3MP-14]